MSDLRDLDPQARKRKVRSEYQRAALGAVAGGTTLAAVGMRAAPAAAKVLLKRPKVTSSRLRSVVANEDRWKERANNTWLYGAVPGGIATLAGAKATAADANLSSRKMRSDGALRAKPKPAPEGFSLLKADQWRARGADQWRDYVSPQANAGYDYLQRGRRRDAAAVAGTTALTGVGLASLARKGKANRIAGGVMTAAGLVQAPAAMDAVQRRRRWKDKADKIKARGQQRQADALPVAKSLVRPPAGPVVGAAMTRSHTVRTASGKMTQRRGALVRTVRRTGV